jgi:cytochrome c biogenesis protein CcdA
VSTLSPILAYLAGVLSILSPCVLPLVPIVLSSAAVQHRLAPLALAAGLAFSFTLVGVFVATIGFSIGIDSDIVRKAGGAALSLIGVVLLTPSLQLSFAHAAGPVGAWASQRVEGFQAAGLSGQAGLGALLGAVWSPCVGPTLGAASLLAAQGQNLTEVVIVMLAFGFGAASILAALGYLSAGLMQRLKARMRTTGAIGRTALGGALIVLGLLIVVGADRMLEAYLVEISPDWLTALTTRY